MASILDGPDTAAAAGKPVEPAVGSGPGSPAPAAQTTGASQEAGQPEGRGAAATPTPGAAATPTPGGRGGSAVHPIMGFTVSLAAALDLLGPVPGWSMSPVEQREVLVALRAQ